MNLSPELHSPAAPARRLLAAAAVAALGALGACATGPAYRPPATPAPAAFKEAPDASAATNRAKAR